MKYSFAETRDSFVDVIIVAKDNDISIEIPASILILSGVSIVFRKMFTFGGTETQNFRVEIKDLPSAKLFSYFIDSIYLGDARAALDNLEYEDSKLYLIDLYLRYEIETGLSYENELLKMSVHSENIAIVHDILKRSLKDETEIPYYLGVIINNPQEMDFTLFPDTIREDLAAAFGAKITIAHYNLINIYSIENKKFLHEFKISYAAYSVKISKNGKILAAIGCSSLITIINLIGKEKKASIITENTTGGFLSKIEISRDGKKLLSLSSSGCMKLWDTEKGIVLISFKHEFSPIRDIALSPDGDIVISISAYEHILFWKRGSSIGHFQSQGVAKMLFSPSGEKIAFIGNRGGIEFLIFDENGVSFHSRSNIEWDGILRDACFSSENELIISTSRGEVRKWNILDASVFWRIFINPPPYKIACIDNVRICAFKENGNLEIIDFQNSDITRTSINFNYPKYYRIQDVFVCPKR